MKERYIRSFGKDTYKFENGKPISGVRKLSHLHKFPVPEPRFTLVLGVLEVDDPLVWLKVRWY